MAAGSAAERAEAKGRASARKRGREVACLPPSSPLSSSDPGFMLSHMFAHVIAICRPLGRCASDCACVPLV